MKSQMKGITDIVSFLQTTFQKGQRLMLGGQSKRYSFHKEKGTNLPRDLATWEYITFVFLPTFLAEPKHSSLLCSQVQYRTAHFKVLSEFLLSLLNTKTRHAAIFILFSRWKHSLCPNPLPYSVIISHRTWLR